MFLTIRKSLNSRLVHKEKLVGTVCMANAPLQGKTLESEKNGLRASQNEVGVFARNLLGNNWWAQ
jgi:hypothetical protein